MRHFRFILITTLGLSVFVSLIGNVAFAQENNGSTNLNVPIPGTELADGKTSGAQEGPNEYVQALYKYGVGFGALCAMFFIVLGGIKFTASAGFPAQREDAMDMIKSAVLGLILLVSAVVILLFVNSRLTNIEPPTAENIQGQ